MRLERASPKAIKYACLRFHYAKAIPAGTFGYSVFNNKNEWCGVILYGSGTNLHIGKQFGLVQGQIKELVRMALNGKQESTSKALALSLKLIKKDFPLLKAIVSYADVDQNHKGIIYQATNWVFIGLTGVKKKDYIIHGKKVQNRTVHSNKVSNIEAVREKYKDPNASYHVSKGKFKYIYPFSKEMIEFCKALKKPYPKASIV